MPHSKTGKTNERASKDSREAILRAGTELLAEETQRDPFAGIPLRVLCARAERSTGTFYAHWDNAEQFQRELATQLMADALTEDFDELKTAGRSEAKEPGSAALLRLAERDIAMLLGNTSWDAVELLNLTWARTILRDPAVKGYQVVDALTGETYDIILKRLGRTPRPPLTIEHIGAMLQALVEGFSLRAKIDPDDASLKGTTAPQLYAISVASLLLTATEVQDDGRTVEELLDHELTMPVADNAPES